MDIITSLEHLIDEDPFEDELLDNVAPRFWTHFPFKVSDDPVSFSKEITDLFKELLAQITLLRSLTPPRKQERNWELLVQVALLMEKPTHFHSVMESFFSASFEAYEQLLQQQEECHLDSDCDMESPKHPNSRKFINSFKCAEVLQSFKEFNAIVCELKLIKALSSPAISSVVHTELQRQVRQVCKGEFQMHYLPSLMDWMEKNIIGWLGLILPDDRQDDFADPDGVLTISAWRPKLEYFLHKVFAELRISQLFEIIVDYPESLPAITDLKECLDKTETRALLIQSVKNAFQSRLLHAAVNTSDILTQYVSSIRTLRALDPSGVILENVCQPLKEYLRGREDTIRCIILSLTDQDSGTDLADELLGSDGMMTDSTHKEESDADDDNWMPDPIDALADVSSKSERTSDIINILVNIYGSKDLFVSEYRTLLADRILSNYSYDITNERRYLELLKRKFGECHLHFCDIMLKDIQDSQRINRRIKDQMERKNPEVFKDTDANAFILSAVFWPTFKEETVEPPELAQKLFSSYTKEFEDSKGMRTLEWMHNLGEVELEIELSNGKRTFVVTPAQACVILKFQEKDEWQLSQLSNELKVNSNTLRSRLSFWINKGIVTEQHNEVFAAAKSYPSIIRDFTCEPDEEESVTASTQTQKDEELQVYWSFVMGMLTNMGSLPLDRIHSMLKMFAIQGSSNGQLSQDDVKQFLQVKIQAGELCLNNGLYRLPTT